MKYNDWVTDSTDLQSGLILYLFLSLMLESDCFPTTLMEQLPNFFMFANFMNNK